MAFTRDENEIAALNDFINSVNQTMATFEEPELNNEQAFELAKLKHDFNSAQMKNEYFLGRFYIKQNDLTQEMKPFKDNSSLANLYGLAEFGFGKTLENIKKYCLQHLINRDLGINEAIPLKLTFSRNPQYVQVRISFDTIEKIIASKLQAQKDVEPSDDIIALELAILNGNFDAAYKLGYLYKIRHFSEVNEKNSYLKAQEYFELALLKGNNTTRLDAAYNLFEMYVGGQAGMEDDNPNYVKAKEYYDKAVQFGYEEPGNHSLLQMALGATRFFRNYDFARYLINTGVDLNHNNNQGLSALEIAAKEGNTDLALLMIQKNAEIRLTPTFPSIAKAAQLAWKEGYKETAEAIKEAVFKKQQAEYNNKQEEIFEFWAEESELKRRKL